MIHLLIFLILSSSGFIQVASKSPSRHPSWTNESPSPSLPTQPLQDDKTVIPLPMTGVQSNTAASSSSIPIHHIQPITSTRVAQAPFVTVTSDQLHPQRASRGGTSQPEPSAQLPVTEPGPSSPALLSARTTHNNMIFRPITSTRVAQAPFVTVTYNQLHPQRVSPGGTSQPEPSLQHPVTEPAPSPPGIQRTTALLSARTHAIHHNNMISPADHQRDTARPSSSSSAPAHPSQRNPTPYPPFLMPPQDFQPPEIPVQQPAHPINNPLYQLNPFLAIEGGLHERVPPNEFHRMDELSLCVISYFLSSGLSNTATWAQRPSLSTSIHIQCFLNQAAFSLFAMAHLVFPRTHPVLAFIIDRLSFFLIVVSGYLSNMPMFPPEKAIIMLLVVALVYIFNRFRG